MNVTAIKTFLGERLNTKRDVERAASAVNVSVATMYRYKANPETMTLSTLIDLKQILGLPIENGAAWSKAGVVEAERRRLQLESTLADCGGTRYTTVSPYSVNCELEDIIKLLLEFDYGTAAPKLIGEILAIRKERQRLYERNSYSSWEIWNGHGYHDFFHGLGRFRIIPADLRQEQIERFVASSAHPNVRRFMYLRHCPELPMFGVYTPPGVALVRIDDIHLEYQSTDLTESFSQTFNDFVAKCITRTNDQFISFLTDPHIPEAKT